LVQQGTKRKLPEEALSKSAVVPVIREAGISNKRVGVASSSYASSSSMTMKPPKKYASGMYFSNLNLIEKLCKT
jgi:hypothetical protein